jgi:GNAT superfamily N-acetyltransferase
MKMDPSADAPADEPAGEIIRCAADERATQAALYDTCFGQTNGAEIIRWRYDAGPHGESVSLLSMTPDGTAASGYACSPRRVRVRGDAQTETTIGQTGDVMTHPDFRGRGLFSALDRRALELTKELGWSAVIGLPNRNSEKLFVEKLGWDLVGKIRPWTFVLTSDARARADRLRVSRLASMAVPWTYWRGSMRRGKLRDLAFDKLNTMAIPRFGAEVDALYERVAPDFEFMVRRDQDYLNWRFMEAPSQAFRAHGVYDASGTMQGYAIVQLPESGASVGYVVDLLANDEAAFAAAMDAALGHLLKSSAAVAHAHAMEGSWWEERLRFSGFRAGKAADYKAVIAYVHDREHSAGRAALDASKWYFCDGDRDDELVH